MKKGRETGPLRFWSYGNGCQFGAIRHGSAPAFCNSSPRR
jgi:hypothetical protein